MLNDKPRKPRGFAAMGPELRREIARKGGSSVPPEKRAFSVDRGLAISAGGKGGKRSREARRSAGDGA